MLIKGHLVLLFCWKKWLLKLLEIVTAPYNLCKCSGQIITVTQRCVLSLAKAKWRRKTLQGHFFCNGSNGLLWFLELNAPRQCINKGKILPYVTVIDYYRAGEGEIKPFSRNRFCLIWAAQEKPFWSMIRTQDTRSPQSLSSLIPYTFSEVTAPFLEINSNFHFNEEESSTYTGMFWTGWKYWTRALLCKSSRISCFCKLFLHLMC